MQLNREQILAEVADATEAFLRQVQSGQVIDLQPLFFRFTLATTTFLLFGRAKDADIGTFDRHETRIEPAVSFAEAFDEAQDFLAQRGRLGGLYWIIDSFRFRKACRLVHSYIDTAVLAALSAAEGKQLTDKCTLLGSLIEETQDRRTLRDQCLNVLLAGRDTTACLLSWTL